jgi:carboxyl-terminal processing protease
MRATTAILLCGLLCAGGCAVVDPYGILLRNAREADPHYRVDVLDAWTRAAAFGFVRDTIALRYVDPHFNGIDWNAVAARYRPQALGAKDDDEFWETLNRMTGELSDSHTRVEAPKYAELRRRQQGVSLGLDLDRVEGRIAVVSVSPDSDAWWAGIRPGTEVERIDGQPAETLYAAALAKEREQSTPWVRERRALRALLLGDEGRKTAFTFVRDDGSRFEATLARKVVRGGNSAAGRRLPSGYGYVRLTGFSLSVRGRVLAAIRAEREAPGLIIDLRNNSGGLAFLVDDIAAALVRRKTLLGSVTTRTGEPVTLFGFPVVKQERMIEGSADAYDNPVVILINAGSASASEMLAAGLQDIGRAKVVGQRSCGCLLGFLGYASIPGGGELAYSEIGLKSATGRRIEHEGVIPDVEVPVTLADLRQYRDRTLEAAQDLLRKIAPAPATKP